MGCYVLSAQWYDCPVSRAPGFSIPLGPMMMRRKWGEGPWPLLFKCGAWTSSPGITWELIRNAESRPTESVSTFFARYQEVHMYSKVCRARSRAYNPSTFTSQVLSPEPSFHLFWIWYPRITLLHLSLVDGHLHPVSHNWRPLNKSTSQNWPAFFTPLSFCSQHLPRSTTSAPSYPSFLPVPLLLGVYMPEYEGRSGWNFLLRTDFDRFKHWWAQFREEVESAERFGEKGVSSVCLTSGDLRSISDL